MAISPGPLLDIQGTGDPVAVAQNNFEELNRDIYKFSPTKQNGTATTVIGPPTTGAHVLDEAWKDSWNGVWRCTVAGTPGAWRQETPAIRAGEPSSGTIPIGYVILDSSDNYRKKIHLGGYVWQEDGFAHVTGFIGGGSALDGVPTASLAVGTFAQFLVSGVLQSYKLVAGTLAESSPHVIRPDDYNASTNAKIWVRILRSEYPGFFFSTELTGLTGSTSADLNFIPTTEMTVGQCISFVVSSSYVIYRLRSGTDATNSPTVIRPIDFQSVTNPKVWERLLIVATPGDVLISNNNLSEINTSAKRNSARGNLDVLWADDARGRNVNRLPRGGIFFDGVSASNVIAGGTNGLLALGTRDFTVGFAMSLKDWTPSATGIFFMSHNTGNNRFYLEVTTAGALRLTFVDSGGSSTQYSMTPDVALDDGAIYHFAISVDRDGSATLYINGISDRDKSGSGVTVSVSGSSAVDIGSGNTNGYHISSTLTGCMIHSFTVFNRLLTANDAALLARFGTTEHSDQWGSLSASYTSDFSAGADSFALLTDVTPTGNTDGISDGSTSKDNVLRLQTSTGTGNHNVRRTSTLSRHRRYRVSLSYYIPSGLAFNRIRVGHTTNSDPALGNTFDLTTTGAWADATGEFIGGSAGADLYLSLLNGSSTSFNGVAGENAYVKDIVVTPIGALLDLDLDFADPTQSTSVRDRSDSANHGTAAASEVKQERRIQQLNPVRLSVGSSTVLSKHISATATLDFGSIAAAASADLTITVTGAAVGDSVAIGLPSSPAAGIVFFGFVSASNTVTVRAMNITGSAVDPASATYRATVFQYA